MTAQHTPEAGIPVMPVQFRHEGPPVEVPTIQRVVAREYAPNLEPLPSRDYRTQQQNQTAGGVASAAAPAQEKEKPVATDNKGGATSESALKIAGIAVIVVLLVLLFSGNQCSLQNPFVFSAAETDSSPAKNVVLRETRPSASNRRPERLVHTAEFKVGQAYCDKYVPVAGTTFVRWEGVGASRRAICE